MGEELIDEVHLVDTEKLTDRLFLSDMRPLIKDAIVIKINEWIYATEDMNHMVGLFNEYIEKRGECMARWELTQGVEPVICSGPFLSFPLSRPPFDNLLLEFNSGVLWLFKMYEQEDDIKWALVTFPNLDTSLCSDAPAAIFLSSNRLTRVNFHQKKDDNSIDLVDTFIKDRDDSLFPNDDTTRIGHYVLIHICLKVFTWINCRNVYLKEYVPSYQVQKKRRRRGELPLLSYHTIHIKSSKGGVSRGDQGLWDNRYHICRGHFRKYTKEAPLFGKHTGLYWISPHVRGSKGKGMIVKDYVVDEVVTDA